MLFICTNFPRLIVKVVTSRDTFFELVAQTTHFCVKTAAQAIDKLIKNILLHPRTSFNIYTGWDMSPRALLLAPQVGNFVSPPPRSLFIFCPFWMWTYNLKSHYRAMHSYLLCKPYIIIQSQIVVPPNFMHCRQSSDN